MKTRHAIYVLCIWGFFNLFMGGSAYGQNSFDQNPSISGAFWGIGDSTVADLNTIEEQLSPRRLDTNWSKSGSNQAAVIGLGIGAGAGILLSILLSERATGSVGIHPLFVLGGAIIGYGVGTAFDQITPTPEHQLRQSAEAGTKIAR